MNMGTFLGVLFGVILGAGITWYFSNLYYKKAAAELLQESTELRKLLHVILHTFENEGFEFVKDGKGDYKGIKVNVAAQVNIKTQTGEPEIKVKGI